VNQSLITFILYKYTLSTTAPRRKLHDEDNESDLICDTDAGGHVEYTDSEEDEDDNDNEKQSSPSTQKQKFMK
jgi:hypothetical protein